MIILWSSYKILTHQSLTWTQVFISEPCCCHNLMLNQSLIFDTNENIISKLDLESPCWFQGQVWFLKVIILLTSDLNSCILSLIPLVIWATEGNHDLIQESDTKRYTIWTFELDSEYDDVESELNWCCIWYQMKVSLKCRVWHQEAWIFYSESDIRSLISIPGLPEFHSDFRISSSWFRVWYQLIDCWFDILVKQIFFFFLSSRTKHYTSGVSECWF